MTYPQFRRATERWIAPPGRAARSATCAFAVNARRPRVALFAILLAALPAACRPVNENGTAARETPAPEAPMNDDAPVAAQPAGPTHWEGPQCGIATPGARLISDEAAWAALWKEAFGPAAAAPAVDFGRQFAVAAFAGSRNTGGYALELLPPRREAGRTVVPIRLRKPSPTGFVIQAFTTPYAIQLYPRVDGPVELERVDW